MRRLFLLALLPGLLAADDRWVRFTSGPFEVLTSAGSRDGRETLVRFEQFRYALGQVVGEPDLATPQPVRVVLFKDPRGWSKDAPFAPGRDRFNLVLGEKAAEDITPEVWRSLARLLLDSSTTRMPEAYEHGLLEFFSTFRSDGTHITAGTPPAKPDLDWARVHLLIADPEYAGRTRILFYNLRKGLAADVASRNAFGKPAAELEAQARQHLAAGKFETTPLTSLPMAPTDFPERPVSDADARLARADLLSGARSAAEYNQLLRDKVKIAEAEEGLGLLALREKRGDEARTHFQASIQAGSGSARCFIEYARLEPDNAKANDALLHAAGINSKLAEPFALMAERDTDPARRLAHWKAAAERDPRNSTYWRSMAETALAQHDFATAAKAWLGGEQAATDPSEREKMHHARLAIEGQRLDYEAAEKKRKAEEEAREIEKLKAEERQHLRELEARYSERPGSAQKPVEWWDGPHPAGKVAGSLRQVDCLGKQARLIVETDDHKTVKLLVSDPSAIAVSGAGELSLGCGAQKARRVSIEYVPKANARLATTGEVATIEFQ